MEQAPPKAKLPLVYSTNLVTPGGRPAPASASLSNDSQGFFRYSDRIGWLCPFEVNDAASVAIRQVRPPVEPLLFLTFCLQKPHRIRYLSSISESDNAAFLVFMRLWL